MSEATESSRCLKRSPIRVAVLAVIIDRHGYVYEIAQRFHRRFGSMIRVSDQRIYQVVDDLEAAGLIERLALPASELERRAPRRHYGATRAGIETHIGWLSEGLRHDGRRDEMHLALLATAASDQTAALGLLAEYERHVLAEMSQAAPATGLLADLIGRERRMLNEASLRWIAYARQRLTGSA